MSKLIVAPIIAIGTIYSGVIFYALHHRMYSIAGLMFSYGVVLLGARIAQLISRLNPPDKR